MSVRSVLVCALWLCASPYVVAQDVRIHELPTRICDAITPDLRIRESTENGQRRLALVATLQSTHGYPFFNPFGDFRIGRAYSIVLTDAMGSILHTVVKGSSAAGRLPDQTHWKMMYGWGVVGRCHWSRQEEGTASLSNEDLADLPRVPAGRYSLVMLVTQRMLPGGFQVYQISPEKWIDLALDKPAYASAPVLVDVDAQGEYHPVFAEGVDGRFVALEIDTHLSPERDLSLTVSFVNPAEAWLIVPGLDLFLPRERSTHFTIVREDEAPFQQFHKLRGGSYSHAIPQESDGILVPRDGVIGGTNSCIADAMAPGNYLVTAEIDESIYKDKLFVDGKKVIRKQSEWPIAFRSRTVTITVPQKSP